MIKIISIHKLLFTILLSFLFSSCGNYNEISLKEVNNVKFRGLKQRTILLNLDVEIDNPNTRKISVTDIEFKAWMNNRELGNFRITEPIKLTPCSKKSYIVPVEIELLTIADAFRLVSTGSIEGILDRIEVEGYIKGKTFLIPRKIRISRQPFSSLASNL